MALTRIDTGEQATPLSELEKRTDAYKDMTDNQLLREALAKSSVNCNGLIKNQNSLVKGLTDEVKSLKENNEYEMRRMTRLVTATVDEFREVAREERQFKTDISQTIKNEITRSVNDVQVYAKKAVDESVKEVKEELKTTVKEIQKQREEMQVEGGFRKFMFWATPILLFAQSIAMALLLLR